MVNLITSEDVRLRLHLPDDSEVGNIIDASILGAMPMVEGILRTQFDPGDAVDLFRVEEGSLTRDGTYHFMLRNGFVSDVVVSSGSSVTEQTDPETILRVDAERGIVVINSISSVVQGPYGYRSMSNSPIFPYYFKVEYHYGVDESEVPVWLKEVLVAQTVQLMSTQQINDEKPELNQIFNIIKNHGIALVDRHLRKDGFALRPI